jgi:hypothetical protein
MIYLEVKMTSFHRGSVKKNQERFEIRERHIYVIVDKFSRCYVGQSVTPKSRINAHLRGKEITGKWLEEIGRDVIWAVVDMCCGHYWAGQKLEYKWRAIALLNGYNLVDIEGDLNIREDILQLANECANLWPFHEWQEVSDGW